METKALAPSTRAGGRWSNFSISGKGDVHLRPPRAAARLDHARQAMQGLRAEHQVDVRRALDDGRALLAGHAAAHADQQARVALLQVAHAAQVGEHLLLGLLAHRAGVEQDQVRLVGVVGRLQPLGGAQHVGHLVRVVLVHLAAEGADVDLAGHVGRCEPFAVQGLASGDGVGFAAAIWLGAACWHPASGSLPPFL